MKVECAVARKTNRCSWVCAQQLFLRMHAPNFHVETRPYNMQCKPIYRVGGGGSRGLIEPPF